MKEPDRVLVEELREYIKQNEISIKEIGKETLYYLPFFWQTVYRLSKGVYVAKKTQITICKWLDIHHYFTEDGTLVATKTAHSCEQWAAIYERNKFWIILSSTTKLAKSRK